MSDSKPKKRKRKEVNPLPWVILVVALLVAGIWAVSRGSSKSGAKPKVEETMTITLPPPPPPVTPPPPPPPPPAEQPPEEDMLVQDAVEDDEEQPEEPSAEPPPDLDLGPGSAGGTGPAIGSGGNGNGRIGGTGNRASASKFGWYAAKVQSSIRDALARNASTRTATFSSLNVKIWADTTGRITRVQLVSSSGNSAVDQAIRSRILTGLQLPQGPPADLPMPINLRISARKPAI
jgi:periplasmic protein TonB